MSNRQAPARPIIALTAFSFLCIASVIPAHSQPEAQAATISKKATAPAKLDAGGSNPDRSLYIKPRSDSESRKLTFNFTRSTLPYLPISLQKTLGENASKVQKTDITWNVTTSHKKISSLASISVHRRKQHEGYIVDVTYPQFKGDWQLPLDQLNRKAVVNANIPNKAGEFNGISYEYTCSFENQLVSPDLVSSKFEFYKDNGGAYGAYTLVPFNYEVKETVKELKLTDLLGKPVDYDWLASICFTALQQEYGEDLYDEPDELLLKDQDFSKFTFDTSGITFFFDQGDIMPYAIGCPSVTLTYVELKPLLSPKSPVYKFLNDGTQSEAHPQTLKANCAS